MIVQHCSIFVFDRGHSRERALLFTAIDSLVKNSFERV